MESGVGIHRDDWSSKRPKDGNTIYMADYLAGDGKGLMRSSAAACPLSALDATRAAKTEK